MCGYYLWGHWQMLLCEKFTFLGRSGEDNSGRGIADISRRAPSCVQRHFEKLEAGLRGSIMK
jgi:hypothetical protein